MKKLLLSFIVLSSSFIAMNAQSQIQQGHFFFETAPFFITYGQSRQVREIIDPITPTSNDTSRSSTSTVHTGINLALGYFTGKHFALGIYLGNSDIPNYYLFARYYFPHKHPDSAKVDFFVQVNVSADYTSTNNPTQYSYYNGGYNYNSPYSNNTATLYGALRAGASFHLARHWALETMLAMHITMQQANSHSYTITEYEYGQTYPYPYPMINIEPATQTNVLNQAVNFTLGLHYFL
jgi:hypothetical protein